jgi:hypothetical protein
LAVVQRVVSPRYGDCLLISDSPATPTRAAHSAHLFCSAAHLRSLSGFPSPAVRR